MSRPISTATLNALELVRLGASPIKAAAQCGISRSTLSRALKATRCQTCGQTLPSNKKACD